MKKRFILFSAIVGGALFFQGCENVEEAVNKAKADAEAACTAKLDELNTQLTAANDMVASITSQKDSLQAVVDSLTAPKGSAKKPVATKKPAPAPAPEAPKSNKLDVGQQTGGQNKLDVGQKSGGTGKLDVGQKKN
jgi:peptidoglycan hydrolase CwlO-like protein